jgi:hypothetical protein
MKKTALNPKTSAGCFEHSGAWSGLDRDGAGDPGERARARDCAIDAEFERQA